MKFSDQLKLLANGINPETGELLEQESLTNKPEVIRILYALVEELSGSDKPVPKKPKLTLEERRQKNISEGRPPKSHFPWSDEDRASLVDAFKEDPNIKLLAKSFERSTLAIAVQLQNLKLISDDDFDSIRHQE